MNAPPRKVLIVDDEADLLELVSSRLAANGYHVLTASSGALGVEAALQEKPNLILLDVTMPRMDGWRVLQTLRENDATKNIPVIMLTAKGETEAILKSQHLRATDYFVKPFETEAFLSFIERYI